MEKPDKHMNSDSAIQMRTSSNLGMAMNHGDSLDMDFSFFTLKILWHDLMSPVRLLRLEHTMRETASSPSPSVSRPPTCCQHGLYQSLRHGLAHYLLISVLLPWWTPNSRPPNSSLSKCCAHMPAFSFMSVPAICSGVLASPQVKPLQSLTVFAHRVLSGSGTECFSVIPPTLEGQMKILPCCFLPDSPWCADSRGRGRGSGMAHPLLW